MSLPFGGVFDLDNNWRTPHHTFHQKGDCADIPTTAASPKYPADYKAPDANAQAFLNLSITKYQAMPIKGTCGGSCIEGDHVHFRWSVP
jgi:hypothetical protein